MTQPSESPQPSQSLPPSYFDAKYAENLDPWDFETSAYEDAKYTATLAALPRERYRSAWEIGCSIGVLTKRLAPRCERLLSIDVSERALARAKERCKGIPQVHFEIMRVPQQLPNDRFDLVLVSEVGYYWAWDDLLGTQRAILDRLQSGGHLLLVHWTPFVDDYPLTGDQVHEACIERCAADLHHLHGRREARYRLDLLERC